MQCICLLVWKLVPFQTMVLPRVGEIDRGDVLGQLNFCSPPLPSHAGPGRAFRSRSSTVLPPERISSNHGSCNAITRCPTCCRMLAAAVCLPPQWSTCATGQLVIDNFCNDDVALMARYTERPGKEHRRFKYWHANGHQDLRTRAAHNCLRTQGGGSVERSRRVDLLAHHKVPNV